jgi:lipid A 3-O-deacylase
MKHCGYTRRSLPARLQLRLMGLAFSVLLFAPAFSPAAEFSDILSPSAILFGYGSSYPGWGETKERVETIDLAVRYEIPKYMDLGSSWYKGYHSVLIEVPVHFLINRTGWPMTGLNFLANYTFTAWERFHPYIFAGGGPLYVSADIPGMGSHFPGNYQAGIGLRYPLESQHDLLFEVRYHHVSKSQHDLLFEVRYHHVSNANTADPNDPLNSLKFMIGYTF